MFSPQATPPPKVVAPPPAPPPLSPEDHAELAAAERRIPPKWQALDTLLSDFRATDARLRITRR